MKVLIFLVLVAVCFTQPLHWKSNGEVGLTCNCVWENDGTLGTHQHYEDCVFQLCEFYHQYTHCSCEKASWPTLFTSVASCTAPLPPCIPAVVGGPENYVTYADQVTGECKCMWVASGGTHPDYESCYRDGCNYYYRDTECECQRASWESRLSQSDCQASLLAGCPNPHNEVAQSWLWNGNECVLSPTGTHTTDEECYTAAGHYFYLDGCECKVASWKSNVTLTQCLNSIPTQCIRWKLTSGSTPNTASCACEQSSSGTYLDEAACLSAGCAFSGNYQALNVGQNDCECRWVQAGYYNYHTCHVNACQFAFKQSDGNGGCTCSPAQWNTQLTMANCQAECV